MAAPSPSAPSVALSPSTLPLALYLTSRPLPCLSLSAPPSHPSFAPCVLALCLTLLPSGPSFIPFSPASDDDDDGRQGQWTTETIFNAIFEVMGNTPTPKLKDLLLEKISVDFKALDAFYSNKDKEVQHGDTRFLTDAHFLQLRQALEMHDSQYRASGATVHAPSAPALAQSAPPVPVAEAVLRMPPPIPCMTAPQPTLPAPVTEAALPGPIAQPILCAPAAQPTCKPAPPAPMVAPSPTSLLPMCSNVATTQETFNFPPTINPSLIGSRAAPPLVQASVVGNGPKVLPRTQSAAPPGHAPAQVPVRSQSTSPAAKGEPATAQNVHYQPPVRLTTHGSPPAPIPNPVKSTSTRQKICLPEMVVDDDDNDNDERNPAPGTVPSMAGPTMSADAPFTLILSAQPFYTFPPSGEFVPMDPLNRIPVGYDTFPTGAFVSPTIVPPLNGQPSYANAEVQPVNKNLGLQCDYCISQSVVCCLPPPPGIKAGQKERPKEACKLCAQRKHQCTYNGKQKDTKGKSQGKSDASGDTTLDAKSETRSDIIDMTNGDSSKVLSVVEVEEDKVHCPLEVAREQGHPLHL
ncbi:unnamed protein product [Cyclocybe aegerita]|uniref:Zn(2)-C6 fungal-type domain-containing protein n=1 Tax=Cyclocybe aegerita TaxID=1973307 RepID=A0A8S0W6E4_CYCAE|nr:unnamed protein product [Cyclocybe aegerita]